MDRTMDKFGPQIKKARQDAEIPLEELAKRCDINPSYLRGIESGRKTPSHSLLVRICKETGKEPNYFYAPYIVIHRNTDRLDEIVGQLGQREREQSADVLGAIYPHLDPNK